MIKTLKFISDPDVTVKIEGDLDEAKAEFSSNLRKRMAATGTLKKKRLCFDKLSIESVRVFVRIHFSFFD